MALKMHAARATVNESFLLPLVAMSVQGPEIPMRAIHHALAELTSSACNVSSARKFGIGAVPRQIAVYASMAAALPNAATICEIGLNCGHSATTFLEANPHARVVSFDLPGAPWGMKARAYLRSRYGQRLEIVDGRSSHTMKDWFREHPDVRCDLASVDGDHAYYPTMVDIANVLQRVRCNGSVLLDDVCDPNRCHAHRLDGTNHDAVVGPTMAWHEAVRTGHLVPVGSWFADSPDRGWVHGRSRCLRGTPLPIKERYSPRPVALTFVPDRPWSQRTEAKVQATYALAKRKWGPTPKQEPPPPAPAETARFVSE